MYYLIVFEFVCNHSFAGHIDLSFHLITPLHISLKEKSLHWLFGIYLLSSDSAELPFILVPYPFVCPH